MTIKNRLIATLKLLIIRWLLSSVAIVILVWRKKFACRRAAKICFLNPNDARKKEKALKTISFSKLFPYLCLFLLRLRKNEVENYADDGGETDAGNGEGTG